MKKLVLMSLLSLSLNAAANNGQVDFSHVRNADAACSVERGMLYVFSHQEKKMWAVESLADIEAGVFAVEIPVHSYYRARCLSCATVRTTSWGENIDTFNLSRNPNNNDEVILSYSINEINIHGETSVKTGTVACVSLPR